MPMTACSLAGNVVHANLTEETFGLARSEMLTRDGWSARPLVHEGELRVALVALAAGGAVVEHRATGPVLMQGVSGSIRVRVGEQLCTLEPGDLVSFPAGNVHAVDSPRGGAFLLVAAGEESA